MAEQTLQEAYELVFRSPAGIRVLRDMIEITGFLSVFPQGADPAVLAHQNGTRAVFAQVYGILMSTPGGREAVAVALSPASTQE